MHDYLAIAPLLPSLPEAAPTADDLAAFAHATAESAQRAVDVAESLDAELAYHVATAIQPDDSSDISAYLDTRFVAAPVLDALMNRGITAGQNVSVPWSSCSLRPLTRFGLLVRIALTADRDAVLDGAREEIAAHRRRGIHRAAADHPADCTMAFCNSEPCYWPTCPDAIVDEPAKPASAPATPTLVTGDPALSASTRGDSEPSSTMSPRTPGASHTDRSVANGWWTRKDVEHCGDPTTTTGPATESVTEAAGSESPVQAAQRAIATARVLSAPLREEIVAANNDPDGHEHVIYIEAMFSDPATDAELISRGLVNEHSTIVDWFPLPLHRLTPFGLLVRIVLTIGPERVLALARDEVERHRALEAHRAVPGHHPATCGWPVCTTPSCDWPMCAMAAP